MIIAPPVSTASLFFVCSHRREVGPFTFQKNDAGGFAGVLRVNRSNDALPVLELGSFPKLRSGCSIDAMFLEEDDISFLLEGRCLIGGSGRDVHSAYLKLVDDRSWAGVAGFPDSFVGLDVSRQPPWAGARCQGLGR